MRSKTSEADRALNKTIGSCLAAWRQQMRLDQKTLARMLKMTQSTLSRLETGDSSMTVVQLVRIYQRFGKGKC